MKKILLYYNTIKYLKSQQVLGRGSKLLKNVFPRFICDFEFGIKDKISIGFENYIWFPNSYSAESKFSFLNQEVVFDSDIDWNYNGNGKLWTYNLNYFDFLNQKEIKMEEAQLLIDDYIDKYDMLKDGLEPFPTSLRIVNWIKFVSRSKIVDEKIDKLIAQDTKRLIGTLEYHLLGNHLLENGFALFFAAHYFQNERILRKAEKILIPELKEQILSDGAHFELSPMYHQLMLFRILDCINLNRNIGHFESDLHSLLATKAELMLGWLKAIRFSNGNLPQLNDSDCNIAPTVEELNNYASCLKISIAELVLKESGYRKLQKHGFELVVDIGEIGPDYIPGHAHSDTLSFVLYMSGNPIIVDPGISTYEKNERRQWERSTEAHNTVQIDNLEQSEVWGGFRVAKRAYPEILIDEENHVEASHTGYLAYGIRHFREWSFEDDFLRIKDTITNVGIRISTARFYLYPGIIPSQLSNSVSFGKGSMFFEGALGIKIKEYNYNVGFNKMEPAKLVEVIFKEELITWIK